MDVTIALTSFVFAPALMLVFAIFVLFRRTRRFAWWGILACVAVMVAGPFIGGYQADQDARADGFLDAADRSMAREDGVVSSTIWAAQRNEAVTRRRLDAEAACVADFNCWANRHMRGANKACAPQIEAWAKYDYAWDTSTAEARFTRAILHNNGKQVSYLGDAIKFQNGFGAWVRHSYSCNFDVASKSVVKLVVNEGRL
jgi:hypothetical protein